MNVESIKVMKVNYLNILMSVIVLLPMLVFIGCKKPGGAQYETTQVSRGDIVQYVVASGSLSAVTNVEVGSQVSGKVTALYADYNSSVKKGQLVAEIDTTLYKATLRQSEGELASAKADVILKRQNLERAKALVPIHAASQEDLDQAVADLAQAEATVTIKEAAQESARANLEYCRITSPVDGLVISREVDLGQTVNAAMSTPVLFNVAQDITKMNIKVDVSEADIGRVKEGQDVDFTVEAYPDEVFHGKVTQVRKNPATTDNVVTYQTIVTVDNPDEKLFPGMTSSVSVLITKHDNILKIANAALRYTPSTDAVFEQSPPVKLERGQQLVFGLSADGMKLKPIVVKTGITDSVHTEILDGVTEGATLVIFGRTAAAKGNSFGGPPPM